MLTAADLKTLRDVGILRDINKHPAWYLNVAREALSNARKGTYGQSGPTVRLAAAVIMANQLMNELRWLELVDSLDPWVHEPTVRSYALKVSKYLITNDDPALLRVPPP